MAGYCARWTQGTLVTTTKRLPITFGTPAGNQSFEQALTTAKAAEAAGFTSVSFSDRPHDPILDGWTLATAVAVRTERIRFFHSTLNVPYRFPSVLAKEAATLDIISAGRFDLCLGAGGEANRPLYDTIGVPLGSPGERMEDLEDTIEILRGMWTHEKFSYAGRVFHVENAAGEPKPAQGSIPIWIGARLPRSLRLTGRLADGFIKNGGWGPVEELRDLNQKIDTAARKAGRAPSTIRRVMNTGCYLGRDKADAEAYAARSAGQPGGGSIAGTAAEILATIRDYHDAGVDTFIVRFPPATAAEQIKAFGEEIIPEVANFA